MRLGISLLGAVRAFVTPGPPRFPISTHTPTLLTEAVGVGVRLPQPDVVPPAARGRAVRGGLAVLFEAPDALERRFEEETLPPRVDTENQRRVSTSPTLLSPLG